jgi:hypothetical protein
MKGTLLAVALGLGFAACDSATDPSRSVRLGEAFELRAGESATITDELLVVTFERVSADSRCPSNVVCIRAGEGVAELTLRRLPSTAGHLTLKTDPIDESSGRFEGYVVTLDALQPYPVAGETIPAADYRARLVVSRP